ncbi:MAG: site-specific DNA-methyltransferase [Kiritimatiellae bacterium]|nr:site-specific DNA-methyltransferase [Kiritimatiellia bacterium]
MSRAKKPAKGKEVVSNVHKDAKRKGIPTSELESFVEEEKKRPVTLRWPRNPDLDPQLVWRGKDATSNSPLEVDAYPIYIQEKIHPKTIIADLEAETKARKQQAEPQLDLFADFNGVPEGANKMDFYSYDQNWTNRMILGDSLQVMTSLAEKEDLRGKVQCIYFDPPYGIKFNSNFQWSTTTTKVKEDDTTLEPEMVKAFRDTWRFGVNSYLSYIRDRLVVARDLLSESGSIFIQIGDENVHRVRSVLDEVFGSDNFVSQISVRKTSGQDESIINNVTDYILWVARNKETLKIRRLFLDKIISFDDLGQYTNVQFDDYRRFKISDVKNSNFKSPLEIGHVFALGETTSSGNGGDTKYAFKFHGKQYLPYKDRHWSTHAIGMDRLVKADRIVSREKGENLSYVRFFDDFPVFPMDNIWDDTSSSFQSRIYVVQTIPKIIQRCILMTTDPGDLVLDPTCGSGTTAYVAEQWGRRWITIDTSRVALALARARLMGARYPYYILKDTREGQLREAKETKRAPSTAETFGRIRHGFVYERVLHVTLKSIANNTHIDDIWDEFRDEMDALRSKLGKFEEWEVPRPETDEAKNLDKKMLEAWWKKREARQQKIDDSIAKNAEYELLYDRPYVDNGKVRVAGPFTIESLSPYRSMIVGPDDEVIDPQKITSEAEDNRPVQDFADMILDELKKAGVQQSDKKHRISFTSLEAVPGQYISACGTYERDGKLIRAGIMIGPEFGTVSSTELTLACREAIMLGYNEIISCAFSYEANIGALEFPGMPIIKARMNADLHMAGELKSTGTGNLFVVFGEPDIDLIEQDDGKFRVKIKGVDIFDPKKGEVKSSDTKDIACWFVDTNYNAQSFFVRQAYFLGQKDPYKQLRKTLKAAIDKEAWESIYSDVSRPFDKPATHHIAVKIINHLGDEVMKVFRVPGK